MKRIIDSGWLNLKLRSQVFIITVIISIILGYTVSYAVSGSIEFNPTQKTAFKLIKSDEQSIIISFQSSVTTIKTGLPYHTYIAVPLQGQPQVNITNYLCQVWNQDSIIQTYRNDTTQTTITELAQIAKLDDPECVRDLRVARLTVKPIFDSAGNKKIFTELTIEIKPAIMSNTTVEYIPTIDTMVRNIGLDKVLKDLVINYDKSLLFRGVPMLPTSKRETYPGSIISKLRAENQAWATVTASQAGLYKIRLSALNQIGNKFDGFISRPVHVYLMDKEVPVWTDNQNVILYNIPPDSVYTNTNIYWITEDDNTGISIPVREIDPLIPEPGTRVSRIQDTVRLEEKRLFDETVINPIAGNDHWFWKLLKVRKPAEIELPLYGLDTNTSNINPADTTYSLCSIAINVYGKSEPTGGDDHHLKIMLNNQVLDELRWSGKTEKQYSRLIPGSMLTVGLNTIQLEVPGDTSAVENDEIYLNYVQITYPKTLITHNGYLIFRADQITGKDTAVAEITLEPQYTDYTVWMIDTGNKAIELAVPSNQNRILIPVIPGNPTPKYIISSLASIESAEPIPYQVQDDLRNSNQQADYLIITHPLFMPIAEKLAAYRRNQGLTVRIVNIESIYPQFSYGMFDPRAIKSFLQYTFYYWQKPAPNYVLLIGDASSDYLGNFANGVMNYVPAYRKYIIAGDCASDSWYTEVSGPDTIPDMLIGRFSVNNMTDAESIFNKIIRYEQSPNYGSWRSRILFMADDGFEENCQEVAQKSIPDTYISREIDLRNYGLEDNFFLPTSVKSKISVECNQVLMDAISQGDLMTIYFGHGSPNVWAHERILFGGDSRNSDMKRLTNVDQLTFVVNLTCSTGGFDYPQKPWNICISEDMHRVPNGGAIALYCPSGLGFTPQHQSLTEFLTKSIFTDQQRILGNAIGQMEIEYAFEKKNDLMPDMFILFGDPAMELAVPKSSFSMLAIPDTVPTKKKNNLYISNLLKLPVKSGVGELVYATETNLTYLPIEVQQASFRNNLVLPASDTAETIIVKSYIADSTNNTDLISAVPIAIDAIALGIDIGNPPQSKPGAKLQSWVQVTNNSRIDINKYNMIITDGTDTILNKPNQGPLKKNASFKYNISLNLGLHPITALVYIDDQVYTHKQTIVVNQPTGTLAKLVVLPEDITIKPFPAILGEMATIQVPIHNLGGIDSSTAKLSLWNGKMMIDREKTFATISAYCCQTAIFSWNTRGMPPKLTIAIILNQDTVAMMPISLLKQADISIRPEDMAFSRPKYTDGETVFIIATVRNLGDIASKPVEITGFDNDPKKGGRLFENMASWETVVAPEIPPQGFQVVRLRWDAYNNAGDHELFVIADRNNRIPDAERNNNSASRKIHIRTKASLEIIKPDIIKSADVSSTRRVTLVTTVKNIGETDAENVIVQFYDGDDKDTRIAVNDETLIPVLKAGEEYNVRVDWTVPKDRKKGGINVEVGTKQSVWKSFETLPPSR